MREVCKVLDCDNDATPRTAFCRLCGASMNRWRKITPARVLTRRENLKLYAARLKRVIEERRDIHD